MLHAAHASRYHWGEVGEQVNLAGVSGRSRGSTRHWVAPSPRSTTRGAASTEANADGRERTGSSVRHTRRWPARHAVAGDRAASNKWKRQADHGAGEDR